MAGEHFEFRTWVERTGGAAAPTLNDTARGWRGQGCTRVGWCAERCCRS